MAEKVLDELLCFLGDAIFQIPVRTFMDENCSIFYPSIDIDLEHRACHAKYKKLIDALLEGFCKDAKISIDEAIKGVTKLSEIPDLKEVFYMLFEQIHSATDFEVFTQVMTKRNIMIQEQVLVMIIAATGGLPESLSTASAQQKGSQLRGTEDQQEEDVLRQVMLKSQKEQDKVTAAKRKEEDQIKKTLELSKHEAKALEEERRGMEEGMKKLVLESSSAPAAGGSQLPPPAVYAASRTNEAVKPKASVAMAPGTTQVSAPQAAKSAVSSSQAAKSAVSSSQAANQWLQSAQEEASTTSQAHRAMAASMAKLSPEELKQRQKFLAEQRDKLLAMKKETREKQLGDAALSQPQRPQSARAARTMMTKDIDASKAEDEKKIAMRRAIAEKLRQEVIAHPK